MVGSILNILKMDALPSLSVFCFVAIFFLCRVWIDCSVRICTVLKELSAEKVLLSYFSFHHFLLLSFLSSSSSSSIVFILKSLCFFILSALVAFPFTYPFLPSELHPRPYRSTLRVPFDSFLLLPSHSTMFS